MRNRNIFFLNEAEREGLGRGRGGGRAEGEGAPSKGDVEGALALARRRAAGLLDSRLGVAARLSGRRNLLADLRLGSREMARGCIYGTEEGD